MSVTISRLSERDWKLLRHLRLAALRDAPGVWGISLQEDARMHASRWRRILRSPDNAVYALYDGTRAVGMTGIGIDIHDRSKRQAVMWGSWLEPAYRGRGLSRAIYQTRISWAHTHPSCEKIIISHRASNTETRNAVLRHGFVFTYATPKIWPDGQVDDNVFYELKIRDPAEPHLKS